MKAILAAAIFALLAGVARADWKPQWKNLKVGMDRQTARACVGLPLLQNHGRGGAEVWTYDECGYIQLQYGRVAYWEMPKPVARELAIEAALAKAATVTKPVAAKPAKVPRQDSTLLAQQG